MCFITTFKALEVELNAVEPEVALTISKGDSLVFKISKVDVPRANKIRNALDLLRSDWLQLKSRAEVRIFKMQFLIILSYIGMFALMSFN
jgi:hypothetical protein